MIAMPTNRRPPRRVVRCTLGTVVNVFSIRSVFTRARLLRAGQPLPNPGNRVQCQEARQNAPLRPREFMACRNLMPGRVDTYATPPVVPCRQPIDRLRVGNFRSLPDDAAESVALDQASLIVTHQGRHS